MPTNNSLFLDFPPEENLTPDGNPLITPEELAAGPSIPVTASEEVEVLDRLCEYDEAAQVGCRRTQTAFSLEAEYDTFVHPEMKWGVWDEFCIHEGSYYYDKSFLNKNYNEDVANRAKDVDADKTATAQIISDIVGYDYLNTPNIHYNDLITGSYQGLPKFLDQTLHFYRLESVGDDEITLDIMTKEVLDALEIAFGDANPFLCNMGRGIYFQDGKAYYAGVLGWCNNANLKLGVLMDTAAPSDTYPESETTAYFFAFKTLSENELAVVNALYDLNKNDSTEKLEIVYL